MSTLKIKIPLCFKPPTLFCETNVFFSVSLSMLLRKLKFLHILYLENKAKSSQKNTGTYPHAKFGAVLAHECPILGKNC